MSEPVRYRLSFSCWPQSYSEHISSLCVNAERVRQEKKIRLTLCVPTNVEGKVHPFSAQVVAAIRGISGCCGLDIADSARCHLYEAFSNVKCDTESFTAGEDKLMVVYVLSESKEVKA